MFRPLFAPLFAIVLSNAAAAELPEVKAGTHAQECSYTVAATTRPCETYFYLATPDGQVKVFILATPNGFGFIGTSDRPATDSHHVFPVSTVRREEGNATKEYPATGECAVDISGVGSHQTIAIECHADSEIGNATVKLRDNDTSVMVTD